MNSDGLFQGISRAVLILVPLSILASCSAFSGDHGETLLFDLRSYSPLRAYTQAGGELNSTPKPQSDCTILGSVRDLTSNYLLHNEGLRFIHPDLKTMKTAARDLSGKTRAAFPVIPHVNDIRLEPSGNEVVFSGCSPWDLGGCRCGLALARSGSKDFERLWCAPGEYHSQDQVSWSPDGKQIVFSFGGSVWVMELASHQTTYLAHGDAPRWSPSGDRIALTEGDDIVIVDPRTKRSETHPVGVKGVIATGLEWSPDSAFLTLVHRTPDQPGDSRVRTALGIVDTGTWQHRDLGIRLWGVTASLRWVNLPPRNFDQLARVLVEACKNEPSR